ncbi:hypothetical protein [Desulforamulus reducens]|nr:hypothetical protein [Desulforamulus reducens]
MIENSILGFFAVSGFALVISLLVAAGLYLLFSYGLYRLAERTRVDHSWLAFIPYVQYYPLGKILREIRICGFVIPHMEWVLLAAPLVYSLLALIPFINVIASIAYFIFYAIVTYSLFNKYSRYALVMTIVSFILPFFFPIFVFTIRNNTLIKK